MPDRGLILSLLSMRELLSGRWKSGVSKRISETLKPGNQSRQPPDEVLSVSSSKTSKAGLPSWGEKRKEAACTKAAEEATLLPNLLMKYMEIRKEERKDWTRAGQNRGDFTGLKGSQRSTVLSPARLSKARSPPDVKYMASPPFWFLGAKKSRRLFQNLRLGL